MPRRSLPLLALCWLLTLIAAPISASAQFQLDTDDYERTLFFLLQETRLFDTESPQVFEAVAESGDPLYIAPLVDLALVAQALGDDLMRATIFSALETLTGETFGEDWAAALDWAAAEDVALPPGYDEFKGDFFSTFMDPEFARFFAPGVQETANINLVEVVWGGVRVDGIPSLVNAPLVTPEDAAIEGRVYRQFCGDNDPCTYPYDDELVFGVSIDGDNRAYPLRIMNWHEMFNDVFGKAPLYDAPGGSVVCDFRAPNTLRGLARQGEDWVLVRGESPGCTDDGWLANPDALDWEDGWETARGALPDVAEGGDPDSLRFTDRPVGQVAGTPVMLAYCTLCGSGILFDATLPDLVVDGESLGPATLEFGSTGLLMRSNKLMYDRTTDTVWNAITGRPAFGPLADQDIELEVLPVVVTDWASWYAEHPDTVVLSLETGFTRDYAVGGVYSDYFNDPTFLMFPVWQQDTTEQENKEVIFAMRIDDTPKAYPLDVLSAQGVTNDTLAGVNVVIVARATPERPIFEPGGAAVRAYDRGERNFTPGETEGEVVDQDGTVWTVTEDALVGPDGATRPRLPGHLAFWFGWYAFYPDTLVYEADA